MPAHVLAVHLSARHRFSKERALSISLLAGEGVAGDAHCGVTVQHRSRLARDAHLPNLRQVHLLQSELFVELAARGHHLRPGELGENITTADIDLLALPAGTELRLGPDARLRLTGLRNPCVQMDRFQAGLMAAVLDHTAAGALVRKAGVMAVVLQGGEVFAHDRIEVLLPAGRHSALRPV